MAALFWQKDMMWKAGEASCMLIKGIIQVYSTYVMSTLGQAIERHFE